jgi:S-DNA-T family DNA segregation ATPase FtsK/SpoIIIE
MRKEERMAKRQERREIWNERMAWMRDPRLVQVMGIAALALGGFMVLAGISAVLTGSADIRVILGEAAPGEGSYHNLLGALGARWAFAFMRGGFGIAAPIFGLWVSMVGLRLLAPERVPHPGRALRSVLAASVLLPWTLGLLTLSFNWETGLVTGWGNDHLVGAVGLCLTQWSRFALGLTGSLLLLVVAYSLWAVAHPTISAGIRRFFARDEAEEAEETEEETDDGLEDLDEADGQREEEGEDWDRYMEPGRVRVKGEPEHPEAVDAETDTEAAPDVDSTVRQEVEEPASEKDEVTLEIESEEPERPANEKPSAPDTTTLEVEVAAEEASLTEDEIDERVQAFGEYDPTLELSRFELPNIDLLAAHGSGKTEVSQEELEANKQRIEDTLRNYGIEIASIKASIGPTVTLYELVPAPGVRISKIKNLEDDIALSLAALGIRIIAPIPGRGTIGIEVPNSNPDVVSMRTLIASDKFQNSDAALPIAIGKTISNETYVFDLAKMPHMLMAGATGQGKSVGLNAMLVSLLYKKHPSQLKFVLVDPKKVELTLFNHIERHYLAKLPDSEEAIITDNTQVVRTIKSLCLEMDQRYELLKNAQCRNLKEYNAKFVRRKLNPENGHRYLPYIVLVIDEFADLIMTAGKEVEMPIARLAQLARAIGIHLIIATQRPSVNIITGTIKANFPGRVAFRVTSKVDSRTILDAGGADQLIGRGDMLLSTGNDLIRLQCGFVDTPEVEAITDFIGSQRGYPDALLLPEVPDEHSEQMADIANEERDSMFEEAARILVLHQQGSTSLLQRKLKLGYNRAGRLVDQLEAAGIIGPFEGSKARKVLIPDEASLEQLLRGSGSEQETTL